jgi:hypothetical protein
MKQPMRRRGRGPCQDPLEVVLVMLPRSTIWFTCHPRDSHADLRRSGQLPTIPAVATGAAAYLHSFYTAAVGGSRATTAVHSSGVPVLQLWKGCALCQGLPLAKVGQLTSYPSARSEPAEELEEKPSIAVWLCQLHRHGGDTHGRGSSCGYVLPQ